MKKQTSEIASGNARYTDQENFTTAAPNAAHTQRYLYTEEDLGEDILEISLGFTASVHNEQYVLSPAFSS